MSLLDTASDIITGTADTLTGTSSTPTPTTRTPTPTTRTPTPTTRTPTLTTRTPTPTTRTPTPTTRTPTPTTWTPTTTAPTATITSAPAAPTATSYASTTESSTPTSTTAVTTAVAEAQSTSAPASSSTSSSSFTSETPAPASASASANASTTVIVNVDSHSGDNDASSGVTVAENTSEGELLSKLVTSTTSTGRTVNLDSTANLDSTFHFESSAVSATTKKSTKSKSNLWEDEAILAARIPMEKLIRKELVSEGGHGEVYHGLYRGECVAIKVLRQEKRKDMRQLTIFLSEIKMMSSVEHPRIVRFVGVAWDAPSDLSAISEFMSGGDLFALLRRVERVEHRAQGFDVDKAKIALHVAQALTYLHSLEPVILHRDLKSMNILLSSDWDAKLTDFGVSRKWTEDTMTAGVGTRRWMAPEVMMGKRYDSSADIFSFGVVLSELDSHQPPYASALASMTSESGEKVTETALMEMVAMGRVRVEFSPNAAAALARLGHACVDLDPKARPSAGEVHYQLQKLLRRYQKDSMATHAPAEAEATPPPAPAADPNLPRMYPRPVTVLVIGMAGSGKTTLLQRLAAYGVDAGLRNYVVNLDPAVRKTGYTANVDIRDTVDYKQVMKEYGLGPNGAIMTSLNLFATRFDQVVDLLGKRSDDLDYAIVDTPGQIEAFTWSASGQIITESLASTFPSVIVYVVDTPRTASPNTFMSNMLYACSILYKLKLPFVVVFNKIDVLRHDFATEWMTDFEAFQTALDDAQDDSYMGSLSRSLSLVLEEFYNNLTSVGVSAATGEGMPEFFAAVDKAAKQYEDEYLPDLLARIQQQKQRQRDQQEATLASVMQDMDISAHRDVELPIPSAATPSAAGERTDL
ncbi:unnamed protein product [Phytophthora fragariaefolia]|uniref:GPN-loop GTPase 1 n=1 Tax=Phytophthora fragariaefolia TaxID=1490495 RepID=A0A9W6X4C9_9STRA|nr:unnamed protein product [Phytophthora fragariaefolia]